MIEMVPLKLYASLIKKMQLELLIFLVYFNPKKLYFLEQGASSIARENIENLNFGILTKMLR